jgi:hypothetical protein
MFIGVDGIIVNQTNHCGLTPTVSKVSSGALEFIPLYEVRHMQNFFEDAIKGSHQFKIISTSLGSGDEGSKETSNDSNDNATERDQNNESDDSDKEDKSKSSSKNKDSKYIEVDRKKGEYRDTRKIERISNIKAISIDEL